MSDRPQPPEDAFLTRAFPAALRSTAAVVLAVIPAAPLRPVGYFDVLVSGEPVTVPSRIYNPEPDAGTLAGLSDVERLLLGCIYTRHHDGHVRQRHLEAIVTSTEPWVVPFVVQLVGEYVVEIIEVILGELDGLAPTSTHHDRYWTFATENPAFIALTKARVTSYWNCYYRRAYHWREDYPGTKVIDAIRHLS